MSVYLSQPYATLRRSPTVQVGQNDNEKIGLLASANALIPDASVIDTATNPLIPGGPPASTGSYMRDVLRALATIGSLSSGAGEV